MPERPAPNFTLTDQSGESVRLSEFHGKSVVLTFMDSRCTEVCPLIAQEFIDAEKDLGRRARSMVFVGVNVNPHANSVADVRNAKLERDVREGRQVRCAVSNGR